MEEHKLRKQYPALTTAEKKAKRNKNHSERRKKSCEQEMLKAEGKSKSCTAANSFFNMASVLQPK